MGRYVGIIKLQDKGILGELYLLDDPVPEEVVNVWLLMIWVLDRSLIDRSKLSKKNHYSEKVEGLCWLNDRSELKNPFESLSFVGNNQPMLWFLAFFTSIFAFFWLLIFQHLILGLFENLQDVVHEGLTFKFHGEMLNSKKNKW